MPLPSSKEERVLIRSRKEIPRWDFEVSEKGDRLIYTHAECVDDVLIENYQGRLENNSAKGTKEGLRHVGRIPVTVFLQHPEFAEDPRTIEKFLSSTEGEIYRCVGRL
jgi:hypothetical protein